MTSGEETARRRVPRIAALATAATLILGAGVAWAAPEGRIQGVTSTPGEISFALAAEGIAEGQSIDPNSVEVTIGGVDAPSTAKPITDESAAPVQRTVMLVMDASGSMGDFGKMTIAKSAANSYLDSLPADVQAGLVTFNDTATVAVAPTTDRAAVRTAVDAMEAGGGTALNDAVILTVEALGTQGSRNAVLLSDGNDADSQASAKEARAALSESGVILDAVSLGEGVQEKSLAAFAKAGDGTVVTATNSDALTAAFESAARTVASQIAVTAQVPGEVEAGTVELAVTALVGDQEISDTTAALVTAAPAPSASEGAYGPIAVPATEPGLMDRAWFLPLMLLAIFLGLGAILGFAFGAADARNRQSGRVARRLQDVSIDGAPPPAMPSQAETALGTSTATRTLVSFAERVAATRDTSAISRKLEMAHVPLRPAEWVVMHVLIAIAAALVATLVSGFNILVSLLALVIGALGPWVVLGIMADRRQKAFYDAIPDAMQMLAGSLKAGYSLPQGLDLLAREVKGPFGQEMTRALMESRLGLPLEDALEAVAQRMDSQDFHWVVMAIRTQHQTGGNLAEVLNNVASTLRERERLRRQVRSLTAEGRISTWIVAIIPIFLLVFFGFFRREYLDVLITRPIGWVILAVGAVFYTVGILWVRKLVNMEV